MFHQYETALLTHLLRLDELGPSGVHAVPLDLFQFFSFDTPNAPSKRTSRFTRRGNYEATAESRHSPGTPLSV
jgi:hypothetical protein